MLSPSCLVFSALVMSLGLAVASVKSPWRASAEKMALKPLGSDVREKLLRDSFVDREGCSDDLWWPAASCLQGWLRPTSTVRSLRCISLVMA